MKQGRLTKAQERRLQQQLRRTRDARAYRRTLGVLEYGRGESATRLARLLEVHRSKIYCWWQTYAEAYDPAALCEGARPGRPCLWTEDCTEWLGVLLTSSPQDWGHTAVDWTAPLLRAQLEGLLGQTFSVRTVRRAIQDLDYVWKRPRYMLPPDPEEEKKTPDLRANRPFAAA
jgi:transposase